MASTPRPGGRPDDLSRLEGSFTTPSLEHARVSDAMRPGVIACSPDTTLNTVARMMATYHVHSVIVTGLANRAQPWGIVTDLDVLQAASDAEDRTATDALTSELVTVTADDTLTHAASLMIDRGVTHLLVVEGDKGPVGVVSTLDIAGIVGWGRG
jgi:CBS domain-containing protein